METIKIIAALGFILLLATQPGDIVLWGIMLAACAGIYIAAGRSEESVHTAETQKADKG
ncbi:MAG: hypothetical protein PWQ08_1098 [Clostridiales bacterium]|jgi:hypothetical protein|nr:hypothetical protein [Clostridiales bacterium]